MVPKLLAENAAPECVTEVKIKYWYNFFGRIKQTDMPFGPYPYLCVSAEIDVTPFTLKSNGCTLSTMCSANQFTNPPRELSTWQPMLYPCAMAAIAVISSIVPCAYPHALATTAMVLPSTYLWMSSGLATPFSSTGMIRSSMPNKYQPFENAAWAVW
eukprot:CAMPEP_0168330836 /NCGR_PEP_ID=MMETSP0213-20121227/7978_1 /TAXON_ID=151035 /ORGANISM="Euplotes harpa, Strain FSP1.4" /LENGTH=156 /DNA_ID=CAMNT_0008334503 /DNA_START=521 /DNA_END=991 /DNA_ORIENTATION=-